MKNNIDVITRKKNWLDDELSIHVGSLNLIYTNVQTKMIYQIIDYVKRKSTNRKIQISKLDIYSKVRYTVTSTCNNIFT